MARKIVKRYKITGKLLADLPLFVGGIGGSGGVDMALALNGEGRYCIPGTSLAGALRAWMRTHVSDGKLVEAFWGTQDGVGCILIYDCVVVGDTANEIRDGVGIGRVAGVAANRIKYDQNVHPKGTHFEFLMQLELPESEPETRQKEILELLGQLLHAMQNEGIKVGAGKTRGFGRMKLGNMRIQKQVLNTKEGILAAIRGDWLDGEADVNISNLETVLTPLIHFTLNWSPVGPLMVKDGRTGLEVDILPLVSADGENLNFVLPGRSLKGSLRSHAERILRTLLRKRAPEDDDFINQINDLTLIQMLFGSPGLNNREREKTKGIKERFGAGILGVDDCYSKDNLSHPDWSQIFESNDCLKSINEKLGEQKELQQAFHVGVDRWTAGAADGYLYNALEPFGITWNPIEVTFNLQRWCKGNKICEEYEEYMMAAVALTLLVLRDIMNKRIPIGFGTNRGFGEVVINSLEITAAGLDGVLSKLNGCTMDGTWALQKENVTELSAVWQQWLAKNERSKNMGNKFGKLYSRRKEGLRLKEAIAETDAPLRDGASMLLYGTRACYLGGVDSAGNIRLHDGVMDDKDIASIYEARIFNAKCELRWLNTSGGIGTAVWLSEDALPGENEAPYPFIDWIDQPYLLWGKGTKAPNKDGWVKLGEARIGCYWAPLKDKLSHGQRVRLATKEYLAEGPYGNIIILDERLLGLEVFHGNR